MQSIDFIWALKLTCMDVIINKESVFECAMMSVSILGRDLKDATGNSLYDKVRIEERDFDMLSVFYSKVMGEVTLALRDFVVSREDGSLCLYLDDRVNPALSSDIEKMAKDYVVNRVIAEWLKIKSAEHVVIYQDAAESSMSVLQEKLYYRNYPSDEDVSIPVKYKCTGCRLIGANGRNGYQVLLFKNMILDDISKELFVMYKTRKQRADAIQPGTLESHVHLSMYISKYAKRITERLAAYIISYGNGELADNNTERKPCYQYVLGMPCAWESFQLEQLAEEMHTYIVNSCLCDYLRVNFPDEALIYKGEADSAWDNMKHVVSARKGGIRKPIQPF